MIFEKDFTQVTLLDIVELEQTNANLYNTPRGFHAISYRFHSDAVIKTQADTFTASDHCVCYWPAGLAYRRTASYDKLIAIHFHCNDYHGTKVEHFIAQQPQVLAELFQKAFAVWQKKRPGYQYQCTALLYEILSVCHRQNVPALPEQNDRKLRPAVDYMLENYANCDLSIKDISDKAFISEVYLRKLFKEAYGTSPQKYLISLRINKAKTLIDTGYYRLKEVAFLSGYRDYKYFSVVFKKTTGVSPSDYLQNHISA